MNKIAIVGGDEMGKTAMYAALQERGLNDVQIITVDEAQDMVAASSFNPIDKPFIIHAQPKVEFYPEQKQFVCKGKHQYRQVLEESEGYTTSTWVCQCGEKLKKNK